VARVTVGSESTFLRVDLTMRSTAEGGRARPIVSGYRCNAWRGDPDDIRYGWFMDVQVELESRQELAPGESGTARLVPAAVEYWADAEIGGSVLLCEATHVIGTATILDIRALPHAS
jgi:hypothetical protein